MSKTDKTRPFRVKALDYPVVVHDHINGTCDVPPNGPPKNQAARWWAADGTCYITAPMWRPMYWWPPTCKVIDRWAVPRSASKARIDRRAAKKDVRRGRRPADYQD